MSVEAHDLKQTYRYQFTEDVAMEDVEASLLLAVMATESLHGESHSRLDTVHHLDRNQRACVIDATTPVGRDLNRLFIGFVGREFGEDSFRVERLQPQSTPQDEPTAA